MEIEEYQIIQSIPGIGGKIAATIISEIGEIDRFNHPKKRVAFAGVDPSVFSSGKFTATINRMSKRGSSRLRHTLFVAALCSLRKSGSKRLKEVVRKGSKTLLHAPSPPRENACSRTYFVRSACISTRRLRILRHLTLTLFGHALKAFYDRKREEGKPHKVAIIACVNKLLHWIYVLLKRKEAFLD